MSIDACPIVGLTTSGKLIYELVFLIGIYICWAGVFSSTLVLLRLMHRKENQQAFSYRIKSFQLQLVSGIIEVIKYTYSGFCGVIFMSLVQIKGKYVWWYDATNVCLEKWQVLIVIYGVFYAIPFPFALLVGMQWLKKKQTSAAAFICICLCPFSAFYFIFKHKLTEKNIKPSVIQVESPASDVILSVLQGPYREDDKHMTLYWEAMVSIRRLLITSMTLAGFPSIRIIFIAVLCMLFLYQHVRLHPFHVRTSNYVEGLSLLLLSIASMINLLKASLTDSGVVPTGPSVSFFKGLELCEKMFVFFIIACIILIEVRQKMEGQRTCDKRHR